VIATSNTASLTTTGDAEIHAKLSVPQPCVGAVVLVRAAAVNGTPLSAPGAFIAATGTAARQNDDNGQN
jgi:hypothetical protein